METGYWERTDRFEQKLQLLGEAWRRNDFRLARAIAASLRTTAIQAGADEENIGTPIAAPSRETAALPEAWRKWAAPWRYFQSIALDETVGVPRPPEPVDIVLRVPASQADSLAREVRVARIEGGTLVEVPSQVYREVRRGADRLCRLLFMGSGPAHQRTVYLIFHGNPDAELPAYPTDLEVKGEGYGLDIENDFFRARLSRQMGQLERLTFKREHGLELFAGGEGHGEPPGIDWAHDYVTSGNFQKMRITLWEQCPDYEVVRGPLVTIIRRWGFPHSPVHPLFSPARVHFDIEYQFFAGLPWFGKTGRVDVIQDLEVEALRDDEWVFSGQSFTDALWMGADGKLRKGAVDPAQTDKLWAVGFAHERAEDAFVALFLEHRGENIGELRHGGAPLFFYKWHGHVWSRYPLPAKTLKSGMVLHQRNAYAALHYRQADGAGVVEALRHRLMNPLAVSAADPPVGAASASGSLARQGEAPGGPISKRALWEALRDCKDEQLYKADINVVDLGLVYDIRVRGTAVHVVMAMPHRGRPLVGYFSYGSGGNSVPVRQRLLKVPGVRKVVVEQTWEPGWSSNRLTEEGRRRLGI